jgi:hypothetical protein
VMTLVWYADKVIGAVGAHIANLGLHLGREFEEERRAVRQIYYILDRAYSRDPCARPGWDLDMRE